MPLADTDTETDNDTRLILDQATWEALPDFLDDPYFRHLHDNNLQAIQWLDEPDNIFLTETSVWRYPKAVLYRNVVAWYIERDQQYLQRCIGVVDQLLDRSDWVPYWDPALLKHFDLKVAELTYMAAFALDTLGPHLDEDRRAALIAILCEVGLPAYLAGLEKEEWWIRSSFNWGTATHGSAAFAALAIRHHDPELAATVRRHAHTGLQFVLAAFPVGGGWTEGLMYLTTTLGHLTDYVAALQRVEADDLGLSEHRGFLDTLASRPYLIAGDGRPYNFSNINPRTFEWCFPGGFWWAQHLDRPELAGFEEANTKPWDGGGLWHDIEAFWYRAPHQPTQQPQPKRLHVCADLQWASWRGEESWLAIRAGFNGGNHNNLDLGHVILGAGTDRFLCDPGYGAGRTDQHNAVTVAGQQQTIDATADLIRCRDQDGDLYAVIDCTQASPFRLSQHLRHLLLIDDQHLLMLDSLHGAQARRPSATFHLQTACSVTADGEDLLLAGSQRTARLRSLAPRTDWQLHAWAYAQTDVTTITWKAAVDRVHTTMAVLLSWGADETPARLEWASDHADLQIGGTRRRIHLGEARMEVLA